MLKLSQLKLEEVRETIIVNVGEREEKINIYNLFGEQRSELLDLITKEVEDTEGLGVKIFTKLFEYCTNLEIDEDITEILENPSEIVSRVYQSLSEILYELQMEIFVGRIANVNEATKLAMVQLMTLKSEKYLRLVAEINELGEDMEYNEQSSEDMKKIADMLDEMEKIVSSEEKATEKKKSTKKKSTPKKKSTKKDE